MIELTTKIQMLVGTIIILVYLIVIELLTTKESVQEEVEEALEGITEQPVEIEGEKEMKKMFYPVIFALVTLFTFILATNIMDVLK
jgi:hypothetical protein